MCIFAMSPKLENIFNIEKDLWISTMTDIWSFLNVQEYATSSLKALFEKQKLKALHKFSILCYTASQIYMYECWNELKIG